MIMVAVIIGVLFGLVASLLWWVFAVVTKADEDGTEKNEDETK
jgi:hypothetical protein